MLNICDEIEEEVSNLFDDCIEEEHINEPEDITGSPHLNQIIENIECGY